MKRLIISLGAATMMIFSTLAAQQTNSEEGDTYESTGSAITTPSLSGYVRGVTYGGAKDCLIGSMFGETGLKMSWSYSKLIAGAHIRLSKGIFLNEQKSMLDLREAYAGYQSSRFDFTIGNQIVTWGKTDGFNPTNQITPTNFFLLTEDPTDQKMSNFLIQANVRPFNGMSLNLIGIPVFKSSIYRFDLFSIGDAASMLPSLTTEFLPALEPALKLQNGTYAARAQFALPGIDFSLSWIDGFSPNYGFTLDTINLFPANFIHYRTKYFKRKLAGMDFAVPAGKLIVRGEAAWQFTDNYETEAHIPNPGLNYVLGVETDFFDIKAILQYVGTYTHKFKSITNPSLPSDTTNPFMMILYAYEKVNYETDIFNRRIFFQQKKTNHAISLTLLRSFAWDTFTAEATGYYNSTSEEMMGRVSLAWLPSDGLKITLGGQYMKGPDETIFKYAGKVLSGAFLGMRVTF